MKDNSGNEGCENSTNSNDTASNSTDSGETTSNNTNPDVPEECTEYISRLGGKSGISIEVEPEREYEYIEEEDRVRIEYDRGSPHEMPFDEWGTRRATDAASDHIVSLLDKNDIPDEGIFTAQGEVKLDDITEESPDPTEFKRAVPTGVIVGHLKSYSSNGTLHSESNIDFETLVDATPRSVQVTMLFDERDYTAVLPVLCENTCEIGE